MSGALRTRVRACRTFLLASGSQPEKFPSARAAGGDGIIIGSHKLVAEVVGGAQSTIGIVPMAEPARAIFIADDMAQAQERVCGLFFGSADPTADLKAEGCWGKLAFARSWIGAAAVSMGIAAIDAPYFKGDDAGLEREAAASRKLGMTGKAALYADQLATINAVFTATAEAVPRAGSEMAACAASDVRTRVLAVIAGRFKFFGAADPSAAIQLVLPWLLQFAPIDRRVARGGSGRFALAASRSRLRVTRKRGKSKFAVLIASLLATTSCPL